MIVPLLGIWDSIKLCPGFKSPFCGMKCDKMLLSMSVLVPSVTRTKKPRVKPKAGLGCFRAGACMEQVHMDMLGPFPPSEQGNKYILVMVDQFTKWVEIHALPDITAVQTAKCAVDQFFSRFGTPLQIHTDQGGNFDGNVMKALCHLYHIAKT